MKSEDEWNVVQRVLVGDKKYREYRLTQALDKDRAPLWGAGHDVSKDIIDIVTSRKSELLELKRRIEKLEISQSSWILIGKSVNKNNEKFFLNAVKASKEDIERFEEENFFSNKSWTQLKDVSELDEDKLDDLLDKEGDDVVSAMRLFNKNESSKKKENNVHKTGHYDWVCKKFCGLTTSQVNGVDEQSCVASAVVSKGCEKARNSDVTVDNDPLPNTAPPVETSETVIESVIDAGSEPSKSIDQDLNDTPTTQVTVSTEPSVENDGDSSPTGEKLDEEKITVGEECEESGELKEKPTATAECHSDNGDENTAAVEDENKSSQKIGTCSELNDDSRPVPSPFETDSPVTLLTESPNPPVVECSTGTKHGKQEDEQSVSKPVEHQATSPAPQEVKQLANAFGYVNLKLTSSSSSKDPLPISSATVTGNIWEQRAQKRKDAEEQRKLQQQKEIIEAQSAKQEDAQCSSYVDISQDSTQQKGKLDTFSHNSKKSKGKYYKIENQKPTDNNNGWITFSSKKSANGSNEKFSESTSPIITQNAELPVGTGQPREENKTVLEAGNGTKGSGKVQNAEKVEPEEEPVKKMDSDILKAKKRAEYRQRRHEKVKLKSLEEGEKRKNEHELKVIAEKKKKEMKRVLEYEKKVVEMERLRQQREEQNNKSSQNDKKAKLILETKERLEKHLKEKTLAYQMIGSKVFIDKRLSGLEKSDGLNINKEKFKIMNAFKQRTIEMENTNKFLTFASVHLRESRKFTTSDILEYLSNCCLHRDEKTQLQEEIHQAFLDFQQERKCNPAEAMKVGLMFAESVLTKVQAAENMEDDDVQNLGNILNDYKDQYKDVVEFIGITSYLRTRMDSDLFMVEEDYLVMSVDKEHSGYLGESDLDEEDFEKPEVHDMSCQTEGEPYDVRAASFMPRDD